MEYACVCSQCGWEKLKTLDVINVVLKSGLGEKLGILYQL